MKINIRLMMSLRHKSEINNNNNNKTSALLRNLHNTKLTASSLENQNSFKPEIVIKKITCYPKETSYQGC
jgi:hypothetical protein